jgi:hypothetical protein
VSKGELLALEVAVHEAVVLGLLDDALDEAAPVGVEDIGVLGPGLAHGRSPPPA